MGIGIALIKSIATLLDPGLWYSFLVLYIGSVLTYGICFAIQHVAGALARAIHKIVHFFSSHNYGKLRAVASLIDGSCAEFEHLSVLVRYLFLKLLDLPTCHEMMWYKTITLTRIFIYYPLKLLYSESKIMVKNCSMGFQTDLCAGVLGGKTLAKFMFTQGLWWLAIIIVVRPVCTCLLRMVFSYIYVTLKKASSYLVAHFPKCHSTLL